MTTIEEHREAAKEREHDRLEAVLSAQRAAFLAEGPPSAEARQAALDKLARAVRRNQERIEAAIRDDFGTRSVHESRMAEVLITLESIRYHRAHLHGWMKPRSRSVSLQLQPSTAKVVYQPLGVVGVISPWNYPLALALVPLAAALAAGNRVMLKPSEFTPRTSELLARLLHEAFDATEVAVVQGDASVAAAFSRLPFDHLLFTGATSVGRLVMRAAADNLTPVTLELGGKSPCILAEDFDMAQAAETIATGKLLNAGQTCIAPDYMLLPEHLEQQFITAYRAAVAKLYPTLLNNPDYTSIINERHYRRIAEYLEDARGQGAEIIEINPAREPLGPAARKLPPTLVRRIKGSMALAREEIFGPVLPIIPYRTVDEAISYVNARPRPLALYLFSHDEPLIDKVLARTTSGGVTLNATVLHFATDDLPFGGVGASGMGAYHGEEGFKTFSHAKAVFRAAPLNGTPLLRPPYGRLASTLLEMLIRRALP